MPMQFPIISSLAPFFYQRQFSFKLLFIIKARCFDDGKFQLHFSIESGYHSHPDFETPDIIIKRWNAEFVQAINRPEVKERFIAGGVEPVGSTPEQLVAKMKYDMSKLGKMIKDLGLRAD